MGSVLGQVLTQAVGIAISPIPIIAAILMLLSPKARVTSVGFLIGWLAGILVAVSVFTALSAVLPGGDGSDAQPILGTIQLVLGALLLLLGIKQWRGRPKARAAAAMPKWMQSIDHVSFFGALGLGLLLAAVNPKNLLLGASAGVTIGSAALDLGAVITVIVVFAVIAGCTVLVPVVGYLIAAKRLAGPLDALRGWLAQENAVIMTVLLVVLGVSCIGKGLGAF